MLPARSGSKGLIDKNIKELCGKPLMSYVVHAIYESETYKNHECIVMLNTDSEHYASIGRSLGLAAPFIRSELLASDYSPVLDSVRQTVEFYDEKGESFDIFALVQITSPFLQSNDIDRAVMQFESESSLDSLVSVTEAQNMPLWCSTLDESLSMSDFIDSDIRKKNRQELPKFYVITGSIRLTKWNNILKNDFDWYEGNSKALIIEQSNSLDIDTLEDFEYAEFIMNKRRGDKK